MRACWDSRLFRECEDMLEYVAQAFERMTARQDTQPTRPCGESSVRIQSTSLSKTPKPKAPNPQLKALKPFSPKS